MPLFIWRFISLISVPTPETNAMSVLGNQNLSRYAETEEVVWAFRIEINWWWWLSCDSLRILLNTRAIFTYTPHSQKLRGSSAELSMIQTFKLPHYNNFIFLHFLERGRIRNSDRDRERKRKSFCFLGFSLLRTCGIFMYASASRVYKKKNYVYFDTAFSLRYIEKICSKLNICILRQLKEMYLLVCTLCIFHRSLRWRLGARAHDLYSLTLHTLKVKAKGKFLCCCDGDE